MTAPTETQPAQAGPPDGCVKCPGDSCLRFYFPRLDMIDGGCMDCRPGRQVADWTPNPTVAQCLPPVAPPTPAPARTCKAKDWCGYLHGDESDPRRAAYLKYCGAPALWGDDDRGYCSTECRDAPATSEPGRACGCKGPHNDSQCPPAHATIGDCIEAQNKAAPAQEAAKAPVCVRSGKPGHMRCDGPVLSRVLGHKDDGAVAALYCELAMQQWEIRAFHNTESETRPYAGPERLPRPRLTHSAMWADECEDV